MALSIRSDMKATALRAWARRAIEARAGSRAFAIANALERMTRPDWLAWSGKLSETQWFATMRKD